MIRRILRKALNRPLQGNARVLSYGRSRGPRSLVESYQQAHDRANAMNEQRYQQMMTGYDELHKRAMDGLTGVGAQESQDINRSYRDMGAGAYQTLVDRGFSNGSLPLTMQAGINRERLAAQGRLNDRLAQQRVNYDVGITQGKLGAIERRNDVGPDPGQLISLAQGMGAARNGGYGPYASHPIGVPGGAYQDMYQNAMANHLALATYYQQPQFYPVPRANIRAQENRRRRYLLKLGAKLP